MISSDSLEAVARARTDRHFAVPFHTGYAFAQLPSLTQRLFDVGPSRMAESVVDAAPSPRTVITLLLDGFGWSFFERFADELPFLRRILDSGRVSKLTAQFPSTTAADITTFHTGVPVGESGVFEWQYFEPTLGKIYLPLPNLVLSEDGVQPGPREPGGAYPDTQLYPSLAAAGVRPYVYQHRAYARSAFSRRVTRGAEMVAFKTLPEAVVTLSELLKERGRSYHAVYFDVIDGISHRHGPDSRHLTAEIRALFHLLEAELAPALSGRTDVLLLITADHGHIGVDAKDTIYLDERLPQLRSWLEVTPAGDPAVPAGSPRDHFLYVRPEHLDEAEGSISVALDGEATVHRTDELIEMGMFGEVSERLRARLAPLVVLPRPGAMVWWREGGRFEVKFRGVHGGTSAEELEIPLLAWIPS